MSIALQKISLEQLGWLKTQGTLLPISDPSILFYYKIQKQLGFVDAEGSAVGENGSVTLWYYRVPLSDGTETISDSTLPIIDARWDDYLVFRSLFEMTGDPKWFALAQAEMKRCTTLQLAQVNRSYSIPVNREYD